MRRYLLDTGILIHYVRGSSVYQTVEANEKLTEQDCIPFISVVTMGEILSFATQLSWGQAKLQSLKNLFSKLVVLDINSSDDKLMQTYAEIDSYSKNKLPDDKLGASFTMGKNDIWIASTARVANATLLTTDNDFAHLNGKYLTVKRY
jgi:tRNA(fMet)-specific endonuclease VapC